MIDDSARGVTSNITKVKMRRDITPEINTFATYELCYGNAFFKQRNGYGVRSTGFTVSNIGGTVYMGDIPTAGTDVGKIIFFKLVNNLPLVVKNDVGTIDYVHGEINLDVVNITGTSLANGQIQVEAIPQSNDVIALKDLYLQLDVTNMGSVKGHFLTLYPLVRIHLLLPTSQHPVTLAESIYTR